MFCDKIAMDTRTGSESQKEETNGEHEASNKYRPRVYARFFCGGGYIKVDTLAR